MGQRPVVATVTVSFKWWFWPYFYGLLTISLITGLRPDYKKVEYWATRAMRLKIRS
jgi:hypothetical protein